MSLDKMSMLQLDNEKEPMVSVVVITYNSAKTVVETLNSIKAQTYRNLELIISDDCSKDNTVEVVEEWLKENGSHFVHTDVVTSEINTGVSGNLNRGVFKSHGEWIKSIAGDDLLIPTAIEKYVRFVTISLDKVRMCVSDVEPFVIDGIVPETIKSDYKHYFEMANEPYTKQYKRVMSQLVFVGPTYFYNRDLFDEVGGFSEKYGCFEEWPFVYKIIKLGERIYAINEKLVKYRVSESSLSRSRKNNGLENPSYFFSGYKFFFEGPYHELINQHRYLVAMHMYLIYHVRSFQYYSNNCVLSKLLLRMVVCFSPYTYLKKLGVLL